MATAAAAASAIDVNVGSNNGDENHEAGSTYRRPFGGSRAFQDWVNKHPLYGPGNPNIAPLGAIPLLGQQEQQLAFMDGNAFHKKGGESKEGDGASRSSGAGGSGAPAASGDSNRGGASASATATTTATTTKMVTTCVLPLTHRGLGMEVGPGEAQLEATRIQVAHTHTFLLLQ